MGRIKVLIIGAGQLGQALATAARSTPLAQHCIFVAKSELDIRSEKQVLAFLQAHPSIQYCINAAAYTAVDACETNTLENESVNVAGVANVARACQSIGAYLVHISTDYVFDGLANQPYSEESPVNPINAYGLAKYRGEQMAFKYCQKTLVVRTSWLYGYLGANFVKTILTLAKTHTTIQVVNDQVGSPTYALDLAWALFSMLAFLGHSDGNLTGLYHFCNRGFVSRYDFARQICATYSLEVALEPIETQNFPTAAQRPRYSALDTTKIRRDFDLKIAPWQRSLKKFRSVYTL